MKRCPQCGMENDDSDAFCRNCGTRLPEEQHDGPVGSLPHGPVSVGEETTQPEQPVDNTAESPTPEPTQQAPLQPTVPPPPPYTGAGQAYQSTVPAQQSQLGLWSLIAGIAAFFICGFILGPIAIVLAVQARKEPSANQRMARAGLILGILATVLNVIAFIFFFSSPHFSR